MSGQTLFMTSLFLIILAAHVAGLWVALRLVSPPAAQRAAWKAPRVPREFRSGQWERVR